jgi:hypothetical protein
MFAGKVIFHVLVFSVLLAVLLIRSLLKTPYDKKFGVTYSESDVPLLQSLIITLSQLSSLDVSAII